MVPGLGVGLQVPRHLGTAVMQRVGLDNTGRSVPETSLR